MKISFNWCAVAWILLACVAFGMDETPEASEPVAPENPVEPLQCDTDPIKHVILSKFKTILINLDKIIDYIILFAY
jgi:hypothetical protein